MSVRETCDLHCYSRTTSVALLSYVREPTANRNEHHVTLDDKSDRPVARNLFSPSRSSVRKSNLSASSMHRKLPHGNLKLMQYPYNFTTSKHMIYELGCDGSKSDMYLLFALLYRLLTVETPLLMAFSNIRYMFGSAINSNSSFAIFKQHCHVYPGSVQQGAGSIPCS